MTRAHERFVGARLLVAFAIAVLTQCVTFLVIVRLGLWGFLLTPFFVLAYIAFFGRAFLLSLRRLQLMRSTMLRFLSPIISTIVLLLCSFVAGGYIGDRLNGAFFHMRVQDFDK